MDVIFNFNGVMLLQLTLAVFLPVLVGLVTKWSTDPGKKAVLLLLLSVITSMLTELLESVAEGTAYDLGQGIYLAIVTFVIGVATHYGLWKPTNVTAAAQSVLVKDPPAIAPPVPPEHDL